MVTTPSSALYATTSSEFGMDFNDSAEDEVHDVGIESFAIEGKGRATRIKGHHIEGDGVISEVLRSIEQSGNFVGDDDLREVGSIGSNGFEFI